MKLNTFFILSVLLSMTTVVDALFAQFEGEIHFEITEQRSDDREAEKSGLRMAFTKDRIFVDSDVSMNVMSGLSTSGILVRNDLQDFILLTGNNEGLKVAKSELQSVVGLIDRMQGNAPVQTEPFAWDQRVRATGRSKQIHGYTAYEYQLTGDREGELASIWLSDQIKIKWGLLQEVWYSMGSTRFENEIPIEIVMNNTSFPLHVEVIRDGQVVISAASTLIRTTNFNRSLTEVPSGTKLLGFTDLMMNFFRQQR